MRGSPSFRYVFSFVIHRADGLPHPHRTVFVRWSRGRKRGATRRALASAAGSAEWEEAIEFSTRMHFASPSSSSPTRIDKLVRKDVTIQICEDSDKRSQGNVLAKTAIDLRPAVVSRSALTTTLSLKLQSDPSFNRSVSLLLTVRCVPVDYRSFVVMEESAASSLLEQTALAFDDTDGSGGLGTSGLREQSTASSNASASEHIMSPDAEFDPTYPEAHDSPTEQAQNASSMGVHCAEGEIQAQVPATLDAGKQVSLKSTGSNGPELRVESIGLHNPHLIHYPSNELEQQIAINNEIVRDRVRHARLSKPLRQQHTPGKTYSTATSGTAETPLQDETPLSTENYHLPNTINDEHALQKFSRSLTPPAHVELPVLSRQEEGRTDRLAEAQRMSPAAERTFDDHDGLLSSALQTHSPHVEHQLKKLLQQTEELEQALAQVKVELAQAEGDKDALRHRVRILENKSSSCSSSPHGLPHAASVPSSPAHSVLPTISPHMSPMKSSDVHAASRSRLLRLAARCGADEEIPGPPRHLVGPEEQVIHPETAARQCGESREGDRTHVVTILDKIRGSMLTSYISCTLVKRKPEAIVDLPLSNATRHVLWPNPSSISPLHAAGCYLELSPDYIRVLYHSAVDDDALARLSSVQTNKDTLQNDRRWASMEGNAEVLDGIRKQHKQIQIDLNRTMPEVTLFRKHGPLQSALRIVLTMHTIARPDIGYVQGMSNLAAMAVLHTATLGDAYRVLAHCLASRMLADMYSMNPSRFRPWFTCFSRLLAELSPRAANILAQYEIPIEAFLLDWIMTMFTKALPVRIAAHVWDGFFLFGDTYLLGAALAAVRANETNLANAPMDEVYSVLTAKPLRVQEDDFLSAMSSFRAKSWTALYQARATISSSPVAEAVADAPAIG